MNIVFRMSILLYLKKPCLRSHDLILSAPAAESAFCSSKCYMWPGPWQQNTGNLWNVNKSGSHSYCWTRRETKEEKCITDIFNRCNFLHFDPASQLLVCVCASYYVPWLYWSAHHQHQYSELYLLVVFIHQVWECIGIVRKVGACPPWLWLPHGKVATRRQAAHTLVLPCPAAAIFGNAPLGEPEFGLNVMTRINDGLSYMYCYVVIILKHKIRASGHITCFNSLFSLRTCSWMMVSGKQCQTGEQVPFTIAVSCNRKHILNCSGGDERELGWRWKFMFMLLKINIDIKRQAQIHSFKAQTEEINTQPILF